VDAGELIGILVVGFAAGVSSGVLGIGGGVIFVPGLVIFVNQSQLHAEATSLLAIVIVATVGAWRQHGYGNLRLRDGVIVGALSPLGAVGGAVLANALSERALELSFAAVQLYFAYNLVRRAASREDEPVAGGSGA
jgi:uncharacterized membrane protein YfcA